MQTAIKRRVPVRVRHFVKKLLFPRAVRAAAPVIIGRKLIAARYLEGEGIEIGALNHPLPLPPRARAAYVDRMSVPDLKRHYPELAACRLVEVDILDDGETLATLADGSRSFVIANHFLEHCQNPIAAIGAMLRVLAPGGVVFMAVPDRRFTFDRDRPVTPFEHLERDYREGPAWSREQHFREWVRLVEKVPGPDAEARVQSLLEQDFSIHYHVWDQPALCGMLHRLHDYLPFELELFYRNQEESIVVLRKRA